jgi:hypothetical protein
MEEEIRLDVEGYTLIRRPPGAGSPYTVIAPDGATVYEGTSWHGVERNMRLDVEGLLPRRGQISGELYPR